MSEQNRTIDDATPDTQITGVEKFPISDAGVSKCATTAQVKDYVLAQISAIASASGIDLSADGVYLLKGGALKPVAADTLATAVLDYGFGKVAVASMNGNEIVGVKDSTAQKTITVSQLKTWLQANMTVTTDIDIGAKDAAGALSGEDLLLIAQSGTNKKLTLTSLAAYANASFKDYVTSLTAVTTLSDADVFYIVNGTTAKKCTVLQLKTLIGAGDVIGPASTTNNKIPQWDSATKTLKDGLTLQGTVRATGTASADSVPTEAAVRAAIAEVQSPVSSVNAKTGAVALTGSDIPVSGSDSTKLDVKIQNIVAASTDFVGATSDTPGTHGLVPAPSIANRNKFLKADGTWAEVPSDVSGPATTTENKIPQWDSTNKKLKDGKAVATSIRTGTTEGEATSADDAHVPTEKAVRLALNAQALDEVKTFPFCGTTAMTAGKIPVWGSGQTQEYHPVEDGFSVETSIPASPTNTAVPTSKAVSDALAAIQPSFAKLDAETLTSGVAKALTDKAVHKFLVATGSSYNLTLPASVTGSCREFYIVFQQSGTQNATTTVTFSAQVHGKAGTSSTLTLKKDVAGNSNSYHVYHFIEDAADIWCINEFESVEGGGSSGRKFGLGTIQAMISTAEGGSSSASVKPNETTVLVIDGTRTTFSLNPDITGVSEKGVYEFMVMAENNSAAEMTVESSAEMVLLPTGVTGIGSLLTGENLFLLRGEMIVEENSLDGSLYVEAMSIRKVGEITEE